MKIMILTPRFPFPENGGDVLRINNIARYLKQKGNEIYLVSYTDENVQDDSEKIYSKIFRVKRNRFQSFWNCVKALFTNEPLQTAYYYSMKYEKELEKAINEIKPDIYISHLLRMVPYLYKFELLGNSIVEMTDALSRTYELSSSGKGSVIKRVIYSIEKKRIYAYEKKIINDFSKVVLVSEQDKKYYNNAENIYVYPNGVELRDRKRKLYKQNKIVFVGNMRTLQNQDAVFYFVKKIFPELKKQLGELDFYIVGAQPNREILELDNGEDIHVTGFVDDLEVFISDACFSIAPVRIASGIQNKVLISMACKVPVVLSELIARGIPELEDNNNCLIANSTQEYVDACLKLYTSPEERNRIAERGYEVVETAYSWKNKLEGYEHI